MIGLYTSPLFNSILPERIGYIIQQRRKLLGLSQDQLAGRTHSSKYMISKIEGGKHDLQLKDLSIHLIKSFLSPLYTYLKLNIIALFPARVSFP